LLSISQKKVFKRKSETTQQRSQSDCRRFTQQTQVNIRKNSKNCRSDQIFDLDIIVQSEYKRIKKAVFKRQVEKAYDILSKSDKFVNEMEARIENVNVEDDEDVDIDDIDFDSIDDQALAVDTKGDGADGSNEINNMITSLYQNNNAKKKSNLKQNPDGSQTGSVTIPTGSSQSGKHVHFNDFRHEKYIDESSLNKRKLPTDSNSNSQTNNTSAKNIKSDNSSKNTNASNGGANKQAEAVNSMLNSSNQSQNKRPRRSSSGSIDKELVRSQVNFESFACDQDIKENIFRRIFYVLSPEHFLVNGKTPPRGFLLHGPPGCGKSQLVYAIAGELDLPLLKVTSTELISGVSGESEENIRGIFEKAIVSFLRSFSEF
jgi:ribosome biogenesis ATPase